MLVRYESKEMKMFSLLHSKRFFRFNGNAINTNKKVKCSHFIHNPFCGMTGIHNLRMLFVLPLALSPFLPIQENV